jgi:hypothetical protein
MVVGVHVHVEQPDSRYRSYGVGEAFDDGAITTFADVRYALDEGGCVVGGLRHGVYTTLPLT